MSEIYAAEMDVFDFMDTVEDNSMDGCITDIPYPSTERYRLIGTTTRTKQSTKSSNPWFNVMTFASLSHFLDVLYMKLKDDSYAFIFVDDDTEDVLRFDRGVTAKLRALNDIEALAGGTLAPTSQAPRDNVGFAWWPSLTWGKVAKEDDGADAAEDVKLAAGNGWHGRKCTERILVLEKGKKNLRTSINNLQLAARPSAPKGATKKRASAGKPMLIAHRLALTMSEPGGSIIDPFCGCGSIARGIVQAGCDAVVNDQDLDLFRDWMAADSIAWNAW